MSVIKITPQIITKTKLPGNYHLDVHSNPFQSDCYFRLPSRARQLNAGHAGGVYFNLSPSSCATIISEIYLSEHSARALISRALLNTYNTYSLKFDQNRHSKHVVSIMGENRTKVRRIRTELTLSFNLLMSLTLLYKKITLINRIYISLWAHHLTACKTCLAVNYTHQVEMLQDWGSFTLSIKSAGA